MQSVKLVTVGDGKVGKSCFLIVVATDSFPDEYVPTVFGNYIASVMVNGSAYGVAFWDTAAGQEDYDRLRPLSYPQTDVVVVCFDVGNRSSFQNVTTKWMPEVRHYVPEAPILLLGTKTDLRSDSNNSDTATDRDTVSYQEGQACAADLGVTYAECSSLSGSGVQTAFHTAVELAAQFLKQRNKSGLTKFGSFLKRKVTNSSVVERGPLPPVLPRTGFVPSVKVMTSSFASDWRSIMADTSCTDVRFLFRDGQQVEAHRIILSAASSIFKKIFLERVSPQHEAYSQIFEDVFWHCEQKGKIVITLDRRISHGVFVEVLTFFYSGLPDIAEVKDKNFLQEIQVVAEKFQLSSLEEICANAIKGDLFLNTSISYSAMYNTGLMAKKLFLNKPLLSDVKFRVEGVIVYAHKAILRARCEVMAAMFSGGFTESDGDKEIEIQEASLQSFLALLEYLYTDHAPIEECDPVEIMVLADRFCLPRLVTLCELCITKRVDASIQKRVADGASDVINLLLTSQAHNAMQLAQWCLHFISTNFSEFEQTEEFSLVQGGNREYVEEHRWPPLSYLKELKEFEKKVKISHPSSAKCVVM